MNYKKEEIQEHFNDRIKEYDWSSILKLKNDGDLHHEIFSTDYYIIGTCKAEKWLGNKALNIIGFIKDYETDNFGEVSTDLSNAERVVNMYVYILGEEVVNDFLNLSSIEQYNKV